MKMKMFSLETQSNATHSSSWIQRRRSINHAIERGKLNNETLEKILRFVIMYRTFEKFGTVLIMYTLILYYISNKVKLELNLAILFYWKVV